MNNMGVSSRGGARETKFEISLQAEGLYCRKAADPVRGHFWPLVPGSQFLGALRSERAFPTLILLRGKE